MGRVGETSTLDSSCQKKFETERKERGAHWKSESSSSSDGQSAPMTPPARPPSAAAAAAATLPGPVPAAAAAAGMPLSSRNSSCHGVVSSYAVPHSRLTRSSASSCSAKAHCSVLPH